MTERDDTSLKKTSARAGLTPADRAQANDFGVAEDKTKSLGSGMTFLMVLLNGLILTGTAFAILTVFINEMRMDDVRMISSHFHENVEQYLENVSDVVDSSAQLAELELADPDLNLNHLRDNFTALKQNYTRFDQVVLLDEIDNNRFFSFPLYTRQADEDSLEAKSDTYLNLDAIQEILAKIEPDKSVMAVPLLRDEYKLLQESSAVKVQSMPIIIIRRLQSDMNENGTQTARFLLFKSYLSSLVDNRLLSGWEEISRYKITDHKQNAALLTADYDHIARASGEIKINHSATREIVLFGLPLTLQIDIRNNQQNAFLSTIPFLMMMFGSVLTIIGTLYVHNNQKQSRRLSAMNKALAEKNMELNNQGQARERLYKALQKSEAEHKSIVNAVSDIIFETDAQGRLVYLNESWVRITGWDIKKTLGRSLFDMVHPKDRSEVESGFASVFSKNEKTFRNFLGLRTLNGNFREVELSLSVLRRSDDNSYHAVGTFTDVEERRRAERALAEAEKKYRNIVENASAGIFQISPEGQFLSANTALAKMFGYETAEDMIQDVTDFQTQLHMHPEDRVTLNKELEKEGSVSNYEIQMLTADGREIWMSESTRAVYDDDNTLQYFEGISEDITQRKEAELAMLAAKKESDLANRAKSEFLANMSHELRTPLNAIIGFSEIIKNEVFGAVGKKEYNEYATDIYDSGRRLLKVINEILDVSKIEAGDRQLNEGLVNIYDVARACVSLCSPKAESGNLKIENNLPENMPCVVGEELAIKQMLMNLMHNAVKFTSPGGRIILSEDLDDEGNLRISLTDTGIGMDQDDIGKAISPFGQLDNSLSRSGSGTGLGLTLVNSLIRLHGGELEILSQKKVGTTATLVFPSKRVAKNKDEAREVERAVKDEKDNIVKF